MKYGLWKRIDHTGKLDHNVLVPVMECLSVHNNWNTDCFEFFGMVTGKVFSVDGNGWWNMNCERELITPAVAASLTITKYNVTIDKRNDNVWKGLCFITTEYSWKQENLLIDKFSVASNVIWNLDTKFQYNTLNGSYSCHIIGLLGSKQFCLTDKQYLN